SSKQGYDIAGRGGGTAEGRRAEHPPSRNLPHNNSRSRGGSSTTAKAAASAGPAVPDPGTRCFPPPLPIPSGAGGVAPAQHLAVLQALLNEGGGEEGASYSDSDSEREELGQGDGKGGGSRAGRAVRGGV
ncbi:unnamed protein product, partial [Ectocarpus fasciculatus]